MTDIIGFIMIGTPFVLIFAFLAKKEGIKDALLVFGVVTFIAAWVFAGCYLTN